MNFRSRLVIFHANTTRTDRNGEWRAKLNYGQPRTGETESHHSIGVGLAVGPDSALYYATHDGPERPTGANEYPLEDTLVFRKLPAPYTGSDQTSVFASAGSESWSDLAAGPDGRIYMAGVFRDEQNYRFHMAASFNSGTLERHWKTVVPSKGNQFESVITDRLFVDADGLNIVGGTQRFPQSLDLPAWRCLG